MFFLRKFSPYLQNERRIHRAERRLNIFFMIWTALHSLQIFFNPSASDECDCEENEECYEGDCYCAEGYDRDEFGKCVSMDNGESFR